MRSSEQIAKAAYEKLAARDKRAVLAWRELGNDWFTSVVNSGVLSDGRRISPGEAALAGERERFEEMLLASQLRMMPPGETSRQREAAEHEAAHAILAQSFGLDVKVAYTLPGGTGRCLYEAGSPFQTAAIALAGELWIGTFRALAFPRGATGCQDDRRRAIKACPDDWDRRKAYQHCHEVLKTISTL